MSKLWFARFATYGFQLVGRNKAHFRHDLQFATKFKTEIYFVILQHVRVSWGYVYFNSTYMFYFTIHEQISVSNFAINYKSPKSLRGVKNYSQKSSHNVLKILQKLLMKEGGRKKRKREISLGKSTSSIFIIFIYYYIIYIIF